MLRSRFLRNDRQGCQRVRDDRRGGRFAGDLDRSLEGFFDGVVDFVRATPFMVQLFVLYFGLPAIGVRLGAWTCAVIAIA